MTVDSVTSPELLAAELAAIEDLLQNYEDWRAWAQLEARERQGELPPAVAASGLKTLLLDKLANNTLFLRRQALVKQLEHVTAQARSRPRAADEADDLTRIRGIDVRLERRLNNLAVRSWHQIAHWTPADVHYFASTLGLGDLIAREAWIEQAAALSGVAPRAPAGAPIAYQTAPQAPAPQPPAAAVPPARGPDANKSHSALAAPAGVALPDPELAAPLADSKPARAGRDELKAAPAAESKQMTTHQPASSPLADVHSQTAPAVPALQAGSISEIAEKPVAPAATPAAPSNAAAAAQPAAPAAAYAEPEYPMLEPARPLPASAYAGYVPKPPAAPPLDRAVLPLKTADIGQRPVPPHAPEPAFTDFDPPSGAPAWYYEGAAVEPPHDLPAVNGTPLPLAAAAYAGIAPVPVTAATPASEPVKPENLQAAAARPAQAEVLQTQLPPLPLQPAKSEPALVPATPPVAKPSGAAPSPPSPASVAAASPAAPANAPPPSPAQMATIAAAAAAAAASASSSAAARVLAGPVPAPSAAATVTPVPAAAAASGGPQAASAAPQAVRAPEDVLKAAAERAQQSAANVPLPPPLPPAAAAPPPPLPGTTRPAASLPAAPRAAGSGDAVRSSLPEALQGSAPEARVTIRRPDDAPAPPVIRNPGGTPVHLSRQPAGRFDGEGYAAYHSEVEEAAVQIVKKTPPGVPATRRAVPPLPATAPVQADPAAGARAAAEAAARAAAALNNPSPNPQAPVTPPVLPPVPQTLVPGQAAPAGDDPAQLMKKGAEKAAVTMGRFLKALTGQ